MSDKNVFEPVAVVNYMGIDYPVGVNPSDAAPVFHRLVEATGETFEIAGDATTGNHYAALAAQYGAPLVRRPDPEAAKADIIRQFGVIAVEMGVPVGRQAEAGEEMFASMLRASARITAERDRDLKRCKLPVPKRGAPDAELVQWLDAMPGDVRRMAIENNVRPYAPLYIAESVEPDILSGIKASILDTLDGDKIRSFSSESAFIDWVAVTYEYDARDQDNDIHSVDALSVVYRELLEDELLKDTNNHQSHIFAVLRIDCVDTAAFDDIGFGLEASRIVYDAASSIESDFPSDRVDLRDTNGNIVGSFSMESVLPQVNAEQSGIVVTIDTSLFSNESRTIKTKESLVIASRYLMSIGPQIITRDSKFSSDTGLHVGRITVINPMANKLELREHGDNLKNDGVELN